MNEPPLLKVSLAAGLLFPDLPPRQAERRVYRWIEQEVIPPAAVVRAGRGIYLRRSALLAWVRGEIHEDALQETSRTTGAQH